MSSFLYWLRRAIIFSDTDFFIIFFGYVPAKAVMASRIGLWRRSDIKFIDSFMRFEVGSPSDWWAVGKQMTNQMARYPMPYNRTKSEVYGSLAIRRTLERILTNRFRLCLKQLFANYKYLNFNSIIMTLLFMQKYINCYFLKIWKIFVHNERKKFKDDTIRF